MLSMVKMAPRTPPITPISNAGPNIIRFTGIALPSCKYKHTHTRARAHTHTNNIAGVMTIKDIKPQRKLLNTRLATARIAASHSCIFWQVSEVA